MKTCPYCKEEIHEEAVKCRYCQSSLTDTGQVEILAPPAGAQSDEPVAPAGADQDAAAKDDRVTYILDRGIIRFAKFTAGVVAVIVAAGLYLVGFDIKLTLQELAKSRTAAEATRDELTTVQEEVRKAQETYFQLAREMTLLRERAGNDAEFIAALRANLRELTESERRRLAELRRENPNSFSCARGGIGA